MQPINKNNLPLKYIFGLHKKKEQYPQTELDVLYDMINYGKLIYNNSETNTIDIPLNNISKMYSNKNSSDIAYTGLISLQEKGFIEINQEKKTIIVKSHPWL